MPAIRLRTPVDFDFQSPYCGFFGADFIITTGRGVGFGVSSGFAGVLAGSVFAAMPGFGIGVGRGVADVVVTAMLAFVFVIAAGTSVDIAPLCQICPSVSFVISNSIVFRFGLSGTAGNAIAFPFIVNCTDWASDLE